MPIITLTVPSGVSDAQCVKARDDIKTALGVCGVPEQTVTVWFLPCIAPVRLLMEYRSRESPPGAQQCVELMAKVAKGHFGMEVEALITQMERKTTHIHITT